MDWTDRRQPGAEDGPRHHMAVAVVAAVVALRSVPRALSPRGSDWRGPATTFPYIPARGWARTALRKQENQRPGRGFDEIPQVDISRMAH